MQNSYWEKVLVLGIIALFVGASIIPSTIGIKKKTTLKEIRSPGYIQNLIDNASDGDTIYIPTGTYYENIVINKSISLLGEDKNTTIIDGDNNGDVVTIYADSVNISGFTIINGYIPSFDGTGIVIFSNFSIITENIINLNEGWGIDLRGACNTIKRNIISNNYRGMFINGEGNIIIENSITSHNHWSISLWGSSSNNTIKENIIKDTNDAGIFIDDLSTNNTINDNTISKNIWGINLQGSSNFITGNNISKNGYSFSGDGLYLGRSSDNNNISGNTISSNNRTGIFLQGDSHTITGNTISNNWNGIRIYSSSNNDILDNSFFNNGLFVSNSYHNTVEYNMVNGKPLVYLEDESDKVIDYEVGQVILINCNNITAENLKLINIYVGVQLLGTNNCEIRNNNCSNNMEGIFLYDSSNNKINNNEIISNNDNGICLSSSSSNTISGNIISINGDGIYLRGFSDTNTITGNSILNNDHYGIFIWDSISNNIIKNNLIGNEQDAFFRNARLNRWSQNYWNRPRVLPKLIFGEKYWVTYYGLIRQEHHLPWFPKIDWHPAKEPYDI